MKKIIILLLALVFIQGITWAKTQLSYKKINNTTIFYSKVEAIGTYKIVKMSNGFVEVEACFRGSCKYEMKTPMAAEAGIREFRREIQTYEYIYSEIKRGNEEAKQKEKIYNANKSIIVKKVAITSKTGDKIALEEDKNGDDFLIINNKRTAIGSHIASPSKDDDITYNLYPPQNYQLEDVIKEAKYEDRNKTDKRSYNDIIYNSYKLNSLFKTVYRLRVEHNVNYNDAIKLMSFGVDNGNYKPSDLLFPSEKQEIKYEKNYDESFLKLKYLDSPQAGGKRKE